MWTFLELVTNIQKNNFGLTCTYSLQLIDQLFYKANWGHRINLASNLQTDFKDNRYSIHYLKPRFVVCDSNLGASQFLVQRPPHNVVHEIVFVFSQCFKGQLISKAIYGLLTSPKKNNGWICFICIFTLQGKQIKLVRLFFGRIYGLPICFLILSDL